MISRTDLNALRALLAKAPLGHWERTEAARILGKLDVGVAAAEEQYRRSRAPVRDEAGRVIGVRG